MAPGAIPRRLAVTVGFTTTVGRAWLRISSSRDPRHGIDEHRPASVG